LVAASDAAIVASGTATLETALLGCPMVIVYRLSALSYWLARRLVRVDWIGMPHIILDRQGFSQLLPEEATPPANAAPARRPALRARSRARDRSRAARRPWRGRARRRPGAGAGAMSQPPRGLLVETRPTLWPQFRRLLTFLRPYFWPHFVGAMFCMVLFSATN